MDTQSANTPQTPYSKWLQTEVLHTLQKTVSDHPGEYSFIINCQVMELYWALIVSELQTTLKPEERRSGRSASGAVARRRHSRTAQCYLAFAFLDLTV